MAPLHHHFEKLGWARDDGGDPVLHPRHLLRPGGARPRSRSGDVSTRWRGAGPRSRRGGPRQERGGGHAPAASRGRAGLRVGYRRRARPARRWAAELRAARRRRWSWAATTSSGSRGPPPWWSSPGVPPDATAARGRARGTGIADSRRGGRRVPGAPPDRGASGSPAPTARRPRRALIGPPAGSRPGFATVAAGNIGRPLCEVALARRPRPTGWRWSSRSFQLHDTPTCVRPSACSTNLAPDHLDRYAVAGGLLRDKARLFRNADGRHRSGSATPTTRRCRRWWRAVAGRHLRFSLLGRADGWYDRAAGRLMFGDQRAAVRATSCRLLGDHNVANALAAALVGPAAGGCRRRGASPRACARSGRCRTGSSRCARWTACSGSTTPRRPTSPRPRWPLAALERPFVLLLGGRHKGEPYTRLASRLRGPLPRRWWPTARRATGRGRDLEGAVPVVGGRRFRRGRREAARRAGPAGRRRAAVARLLQLRHVQELRGAGRHASAPRWRRCERARRRSGTPASCAGRRACSAVVTLDRWWSSASPPPMARPAW